MKYKINIKEDEEGYTVWVPEFPNCWAQGVTEEQALESIKDCIKDCSQNAEETNKHTNSRFIDVDI